MDHRRRQRSQSPSQPQPSKKRRRSPTTDDRATTSVALENGTQEGVAVKNGLTMSDAGVNSNSAGVGPSSAGAGGDGVVAVRPPLSLSILGVEPIDEFIREIADFIHEKIMRVPNAQGKIEVEAKLGVLKFKEADMRLNHPVRVETILKEDDKNQYDHRFESNMSAAQHRHFNEQLNSLMATSQQPSHPTSPLRYQHSYLVDSFYPAQRAGDKIRVTRDEKTGEVKEVVTKIRLGNLDIFSPKRFADWRVSVNLELPVPQPSGNVTFSRRKDRMSYSHEEFVIDLTQVTQTTGTQNQIMHELEVEFARPDVLVQAAKVRGNENVPTHEAEAFDELVRAFVNNVRILVRNARPT